MYSVWFLFSKNDTEYLKKIIQPLREKFDFPEFLPHIAAFEEAKTDLKKTELSVITAIEGVSSFKVKSESIGWSNDIWKSLFVNIDKNQSLDTIYQRLCRQFKDHSVYHFHPHISLMYKKLPSKEKQKLAKTVFVKEEFLIERIGIVDDSGKIKDWKLIEEIPLGQK